MATCLAIHDHCCYLGSHGVCRFLEENAEGRRWSCTLRRELGSWQAVHSDSLYVETVKPKLVDIGITVDCGDWPSPGGACATCGVMG
jgi:hypothetical protein